jgi:flagellar protein FlgJ
MTEKIEKYLPYGIVGLILLLLLKKQPTETPVTNDVKLQFTLNMLPIVQTLYYDTGVSPVIALAQASHESAWGTSALARKAYNLFGIKATSSWKNAGKPIITFYTTEKIAGIIPYTTTAEFKKYSSYDESFFDWYKLLSTYDRYKMSYNEAIAGNITGFANAISISGYATENPSIYASAIIRNAKIVEGYI